jgi:2-amino-4-hydroxy-6-hydroxymethyldihydropteridine diphosphokinase
MNANMRQMTLEIAYIALGSNLGEREKNIAAAIAKLRKTPEVEVVRVSSLLENPAVGGPEDSPPFLNAVAEIRTTVGARAVLHRLLEIEKELGRVRREKWEPRVIDLDLLLYGDHLLSSQELIVPHPLMHERRFVLQPLAELIPDYIHPTLQVSIDGLLNNLNSPPSPLR